MGPSDPLRSPPPSAFAIFKAPSTDSSSITDERVPMSSLSPTNSASDGDSILRNSARTNRRIGGSFSSFSCSSSFAEQSYHSTEILIEVSKKKLRRILLILLCFFMVSTYSSGMLSEISAQDLRSQGFLRRRRSLLQLTPDYLDRYPFNGMANVTEAFGAVTPLSDGERTTDTGFYWQIPRSGGTTLKHIVGHCLDKVQAARTSKDYCDAESDELSICKTNFGRFVNADTSDDKGILRAHRLDLLSSGLADVVVSSRFLHAASLFDPVHRGRMFTIMRDPIQRSASTFYYLQEAEWERWYNPEYKTMTLLEYAHRETTASNWMVRWLTAKNSEAQLNESDLTFAKEVLRRKCLILLTDEMSGSIDRLVTYFGWKPTASQAQCVRENVDKASSHNKSNKHPPLEKGTEEYDALLKINEWDTKLYAYAQELFVEQWKEIYKGVDVTGATSNDQAAESSETTAKVAV